METSGPTSGIPRVLTTTSPATAVQWQVGQLLQATVTGNSAGKVLLTVGNRQISAETSLPLEKGQQLTLQVRSLGEQPVLRIHSTAGAAPLSTAIRMLLPRQGSMAPLLASLAELARSPNPPVPPLLNQLVRSMVGRWPDTRTVGSPDGLRKAINNSGIFFERRLPETAHRAESGPLTVQNDFKADLLRLLQLVRHWPGSSAQGAATAQSAGTSTAPGAAPPGSGQPASGAATRAPSAESGKSAAQGTTQAGTAPPPAAQLGRAVNTPALPERAAGGTPGGTTLAASSTAAGTAGTTHASAVLPPPLRGAVPAPQSAAQVSLDLLNRMGNFRTDLLQQAEAALARVQLHQLAAVPREGDRGLLEWLFELPVRRGDAIDLWSLRMFREPEGRQPENRQQQRSWSLQLAFDLPGLGPMQAQVQLTGATVSTRFWAELPDTLPLLRAHLHELRQALDAAGLDVGDLECQPGPMPAPPAGVNEPLINEKA